MRFHGIAVLFLKVPVPIRDFHLPSPLLAGSMQGGLAKSLHSPKQGTLPSPCPSSGVLFRLPSPGRSIIMAPLRASCHGKPRTGCRSLPSFSCYGLSVYPLQGRQINGEADCPEQLIQEKTFKSRCILVFSCQVSYIQAESLSLKAIGL